MAFAGSGPSAVTAPMYATFIPAQPGYGIPAAMPYAVVPYAIPSVATPVPGYHPSYGPDAYALAQNMQYLSMDASQCAPGGIAAGSQPHQPYGPQQQQWVPGQHSKPDCPNQHAQRSDQQACSGSYTRETNPATSGSRDGTYVPPPPSGPRPHPPSSTSKPALTPAPRAASHISPLPRQHEIASPQCVSVKPRQQSRPVQQQSRKHVQRGLQDNVKRTVYISYISQQVTEESLANTFADCGTVMDCRICGDPNSAMRFAFIEFLEEAGARQALSKTGQKLGTGQLRVLPSKTAIVPVNKEFMPRSHEELERCSRTVYVANIDKKVERDHVRHFFEHLCGRINKIRLLGDMAHSTRIAFIEFTQAESAMAALGCSGALLGSLPLRVSPSKTPVRTDREEKEQCFSQRCNQHYNSYNRGEAMESPRGHGNDSGVKAGDGDKAAGHFAAEEGAVTVHNASTSQQQQQQHY